MTSRQRIINAITAAILGLLVVMMPLQSRAQNCNPLWRTTNNITAFVSDTEFGGIRMYGELNGATAEVYYPPRAQSNLMFWMNKTNSSVLLLPRQSITPRLGMLLMPQLALKTGGGAWGVLSDVRIKKNISDFNSGLADIEQLRPRIFKYSDRNGTSPSDGRDYIGLIAQEARPVLPFLVNEDSTQKIDGTPVLTVDPSALTYVLINAVKESAQMADDTESQLDALYETVCLDKRNARACRR